MDAARSTFGETILEVVDRFHRRRIRAVEQRDVEGHVVGEVDHLTELGEHVPSCELQRLVRVSRAIEQLARDLEAQLVSRVLAVAWEELHPYRYVCPARMLEADD